MRLLIASVASLFFSAAIAHAETPTPNAPPEPEGMVQLFNGKDLTGWEGNTQLWSINKDNVVRGETTPEKQTKGNTFLIWRGGTLGDFELRLSFRIDHGNSGVQYRAKQVENKEPSNQWVISGYQAEVENTPGKVGFLYHEKGRGYLCNVGEKVEVGEDGKPKVVGSLGAKDDIGATYKKSDWNDYIIIGQGNHLKHYLNGIQTVDIIDNDPKNSAASGVLALQIHAGPPMWVEFKDVRLKQSEKAAK